MLLRVVRDHTQHDVRAFEVIQASATLMHVTFRQSGTVASHGLWQASFTVRAGKRWSLFNGNGVAPQQAFDDAVRQLSKVAPLGQLPTFTVDEWATLTDELRRQGAFEP